MFCQQRAFSKQYLKGTGSGRNRFLLALVTRRYRQERHGGHSVHGGAGSSVVGSIDQPLATPTSCTYCCCCRSSWSALQGIVVVASRARGSKSACGMSIIAFRKEREEERERGHERARERKTILGERWSRTLSWPIYERSLWL